MDGRFLLTQRLELVVAADVGCQLAKDIVRSSIVCASNICPSVGIGLPLLGKEETSALIRLEVAEGKSDDEAPYS